MKVQTITGLLLVLMASSDYAATAAGQQAPPTPRITILDPVPTLLVPALSYDPVPQTVTTDPSRLASAGRVVEGAAADGIAKLVIRISGLPTGAIVDITLLNDSGSQSTSFAEDGGLTGYGYDNVSFAEGIGSQPEGNDNFAFITFNVPCDFVRSGHNSDQSTKSRFVSIKVAGSLGFRQSGLITPATQTIKIVRPPILFIHGLWSGPSTWDQFDSALQSAIPGLSTYRADYQTTNSDGIDKNTWIVLAQLPIFLNDFKRANSVAAAQFDIVAHSMGGIIAYMSSINGPNLFAGQQTFGYGYTHKLITIDTPYTGSEFAAQLQKSTPGCQAVLAMANLKVAGAINDLVPFGAFYYRGYNHFDAANFGGPRHAIAGTANASQEFIAEAAIDAAIVLSQLVPGAQKLGACASVFTVAQTAPPHFNFENYFSLNNDYGSLSGASDLIVSESSQLGLFVNSTYSQTTTGVVHAKFPLPLLNLIGFIGALDKASGNPDSVKLLLDAPVSGDLFLH
jgi:pimeloyl-ACP methyl ester carboxylesterase